MTAHAAKGLEAKIEFLPDTCSAPAGKHDPKLFTLASVMKRRFSLVWFARQGSDPDALTQARVAHRAAEAAEHRRLLYVAMTRAEERLYIAGFHRKTPPAEGCWHRMVESGARRGLRKAFGTTLPLFLRRGHGPLRDDLGFGAAPNARAGDPRLRAHACASRAVAAAAACARRTRSPAPTPLRRLKAARRTAVTPYAF